MTSKHNAQRGPGHLLTPHVVRRLSRWSQVRVAAAARTSVTTVRVYEIDPAAVRDPALRRTLAGVYAHLKTELLTRASAS